MKLRPLFVYAKRDWDICKLDVLCLMLVFQGVNIYKNANQPLFLSWLHKCLITNVLQNSPFLIPKEAVLRSERGRFALLYGLFYKAIGQCFVYIKILFCFVNVYLCAFNYIAA